MKDFIRNKTGVYEKGSTIKREMLAGMISFFAIVYIIVVNATILSDAGIPLEGALWATIVISVIGCFIVGFGANVPLILVPGMGVNAMFTYTFVDVMGLSWQEALAVVFVAGILFIVIAFTPLAKIVTRAIPSSLKDAITVGLGLFLALIGLEKSHIIVKGEHSLITLGDIGNVEGLTFFLTLTIGIGLFLRNVPGNFLITLITGTMIAWLFGLIDTSQAQSSPLSVADYTEVFGALSFDAVSTVTFWLAVFSLTMVLIFENIGLVHSQVADANQSEKYNAALRSVSVASMFSGIAGSSPTVSTVEGSAGIAAGGRTGITSIVAGLLFLLSFFFIPVIHLIPNSAISPILIMIGGLMLQNIKQIPFSDLTEAFPAFFIIIMIPYSYSIADGIAFGFIAYPIAKIATGKAKQVSIPLYFIAGLFMVHFLIQAI
ncbi:xanthine/uracil permease family protein [Gracilibacillus halophilus YIM-C55.5]|uniref:Xanthine/uracil permease family protein n=1 Tax=Gracilibacillus halophilus YIM-C55.5 TaxID=1308866 RepID=N4WST9_9BACI|nr:NCS2 family permease [Gracilibacillus halophilus]ENH96236.1 xanthine/uracil permease family protein [Gracilibacillus halophilus YIM-C55.5]